MSTSYYEDRLPEGQFPIETSNVKRLLICTYYLTDPGNPYSTIAVVTAPAGAGKSIAIGFCQQAVERRFQSALPVTLKVKVMPRSTSGVLATHVQENLGERVRGDNSTQLTAAAARGIERNDTRLVIFDEGDRLNDDSFEVVRYLQDKTGCPILVVGLPSIWSVIERQEKFNSRVGLRMSFEPLSLQEMIDVVLPQLVFPRWSFDPHNDNDRAMGEELWKRVGSSLRKLRNVLTIASKTAVATGADKITLRLITEAFSWVMSQEDSTRRGTGARTPPGNNRVPTRRGLSSATRPERRKGKRRLMRNNPFELLADEKPLDRELCQRVHFEALERAMGRCHTEAVPSTIDVAVLRQRQRLFGREAYLYHPEAIEQLFAGVSTGVYRMIAELYCSRLERSIDMVWRIAQAIAQEAGRADIPYEAVWAVCMHLEEQRQRETEVAVERDAATWSIIPLSYEERSLCVVESNDQYLIMCLLDLTREVVNAFRVVDQQHISDAYGLVLYDALVGQRQPDRATAGLSWRVPERLIVEQELSQDYQEGCRRLGISYETVLEHPAFFQAIQAGFRREVSNRRLSIDRWATAFDSYLHKAQGYSPLRSREERDRSYLHLVGYNRDPAWQCPALRHFLPLHREAITRDGTIPYDGLHYADELLAFWAGEPVTFRSSEQIEALIWVYLDGRLLCTALARELRRHDGSYRSHRPGRL